MYHTGVEIKRLKESIKEIDEKIIVIKNSFLTKQPIGNFISLSNYYHKLLNDKNLIKEKIRKLL